MDAFIHAAYKRIKVPASNQTLVMSLSPAACLLWPTLGHVSSGPHISGFAERAANRKRPVAHVTHATDHKAVGEGVSRAIKVLLVDAAHLIAEPALPLLGFVTQETAMIIEHSKCIISVAFLDPPQALPAARALICESCLEVVEVLQGVRCTGGHANANADVSARQQGIAHAKYVMVSACVNAAGLGRGTRHAPASSLQC